MVNWQDPTLIERLQDIQSNVICLMLGLYGWEYFQSLGVEYAVIRGRLAFRWPLVPYLIGRSSTFIFLLLTTVRVTPPNTSLNCLTGGRIIATVGDVGMVCCSLNLMVRTWVIWKDNRFVHVLLLVLSLGHCIVLALDVANLEGVTFPNHECGVLIEHAKVNATVFVYSLCYDFVVLVFTIVGLSKTSNKKSPLIKQLYAQGIIYFVVAVVTYITPTVFGFLDVNPLTNMTGICAVTASMIASSRAVRILLDLRPSDTGESPDKSGESDLALTSHIPVPVQATMPTAV